MHTQNRLEPILAPAGAIKYLDLPKTVTDIVDVLSLFENTETIRAYTESLISYVKRITHKSNQDIEGFIQSLISMDRYGAIDWLKITINQLTFREVLTTLKNLAEDILKIRVAAEEKHASTSRLEVVPEDILFSVFLSLPVRELGIVALVSTSLNSFTKQFPLWTPYLKPEFKHEKLGVAKRTFSTHHAARVPKFLMIDVADPSVPWYEEPGVGSQYLKQMLAETKDTTLLDETRTFIALGLISKERAAGLGDLKEHVLANVVDLIILEFLTIDATLKLSIDERKRLAALERLIIEGYLSVNESLSLNETEFENLEIGSIQDLVTSGLLPLADAKSFLPDQRKFFAEHHGVSGLITRHILSLTELFKLTIDNHWNCNEHIQLLIQANILSLADALTLKPDEANRLSEPGVVKFLKAGLITLDQVKRFSDGQAYNLSKYQNFVDFIKAGLTTIEQIINQDIGYLERDYLDWPVIKNLILKNFLTIESALEPITKKEQEQAYIPYRDFVVTNDKYQRALQENFHNNRIQFLIENHIISLSDVFDLSQDLIRFSYYSQGIAYLKRDNMVIAHIEIPPELRKGFEILYTSTLANYTARPSAYFFKRGGTEPLGSASRPHTIPKNEIIAISGPRP